jgi:hypothetical protein
MIDKVERKTKRGGKRPGSGRKPGTPNKVTTDVRKAIALIAQRNVENFEKWLREAAIEDPAKAAALFLQAIEYHIPKQARTVLAGDSENPLDLNWTITVVRPK